MDQRATIDVICKSGLENLAGEIGALLGQDLTCSDIQLDLTTKENLFSNPGREKTVLTRMTVSGDRDGNCYLMTRMSTAAVLGGTLIMLPEDMIEENAQSGKLDGELDDAFGEVANIIAGVFTQAFVDKYKKTLRFIKNTVEDLIPTKIDPDSDEPFTPGNYYVASCKMTVGGRDLGPLEFVVPAMVFELEEESAEPTASDDTAAEEHPPEPQQEQKKPEAEPSQEPEPSAAPQTQPEATSEAPATPSKPPFAEAKKLADVVFNATITQASEEVGALLGHPLTCDDVQLIMTSKADFFSNHCLEKSILTHMKVTGDKEGLGYMLIQVPDAVVLGGTLIMLPEDQIAELKAANIFDGEIADSFGEIANILAGSLTQVFLDRYPKQIRFIKTDIETIVPTKIDPASDQPFAEGHFYLASFAIHLEGHDLGRIQFMFPADIFDLDGETPGSATAQSDITPQDTGQAEGTSSSPGSTPAADEPAPGEWGGPPLPQSDSAPSVPASETTTAGTAQQATEATGPPIVLAISDQENDAKPFAEILSSAGYDCRILSFQDEIKELFQQHRILGIFLIMAQVGEKGFAAAIKLQSAGRALPPIIFAGPEWTKSAVLRAVKYGAKDILVMPASGDEIQDKVSQHIKKAS